MAKSDLDIIYNYYSHKKRMPSYAEVAELFSFASKNAAWKKVEELIECGVLTKDSKGKLLPVERVLRDYEHYIKVLGTVEAGFGSVEEEQNLGKVSLDDWMIKHRHASFMLRVTGDSMKDAGILDGDMVVVERTHTAPVGSIVIAEIDGAWTIKYLAKDKRGLYLKPANSDYRELRPECELKIAAKVVGVVRKYD